jgi:hypothetical protein
MAADGNTREATTAIKKASVPTNYAVPKRQSTMRVEIS